MDSIFKASGSSVSQNPKYMFLQTNDEDDEAFHAKLAAMQEISNSLLVKILDLISSNQPISQSSNQPPRQAISLQSIIFNSSSSSASTSDISTVTSDITNMSDEISSSKPYTLHNHTMSNLPLLNTLSLNAEMNALLSSQAIPTVTTTTAAALTASTASTSSPTTDLGTPITPTSDINVAALPLLRHEIASLQTSLMQQFQLALQHQQRLRKDLRKTHKTELEELHLVVLSDHFAYELSLDEFATSLRTLGIELEFIFSFKHERSLAMARYLAGSRPDRRGDGYMWGTTPHGHQAITTDLGDLSPAITPPDNASDL